MTIARLQELLRKIRYPPMEMAHISLGIRGHGFFPGAVGDLQYLSNAGGVLVLGQDFGRTDYYAARCGNQDEACLTWTNVCRTYRQHFPPRCIWFSNYLMGARKPPLPATGNLQKLIVSTSEWAAFEADCWDFLHAQVEYQRPELIVVLGEPNRLRLSKPDRLATNWDTFSTATSAVDACEQNSVDCVRSFRLSDDSTHTSALTYALHPCFGQGTSKLARIDADARRVSEMWRTLLECKDGQ